MVSVSSLVRASFATQLAGLRRDIVQTWSPLAPDAAFALWADRTAGSHLAGPDLPPPDLSLPDPTRWHQAPLLATAGYYLDLGVGTSDHVAERWLHGAGRLMQREQFVADRSTFVFRPVELLGVALGADAVRGCAPHMAAWVCGLLSDPWKCQVEMAPL